MSVNQVHQHQPFQAPEHGHEPQFHEQGGDFGRSHGAHEGDRGGGGGDDFRAGDHDGGHGGGGDWRVGDRGGEGSRGGGENWGGGDRGGEGSHGGGQVSGGSWGDPHDYGTRADGSSFNFTTTNGKNGEVISDFKSNGLNVDAQRKDVGGGITEDTSQRI